MSWSTPRELAVVGDRKPRLVSGEYLDPTSGFHKPATKFDCPVCSRAAQPRRRDDIVEGGWGTGSCSVWEPFRRIEGQWGELNLGLEPKIPEASTKGPLLPAPVSRFCDWILEVRMGEAGM